ncbi:hypothetical protein [Actinoalloteichus sp. AHMU CJ021]|uniref:hypothetical protein n=1 Tax=Actinoalloteichus sp. AHMU CJ021 TaxID=2072503 RepID=UPI00307B3F2A
MPGPAEHHARPAVLAEEVVAVAEIGEHLCLLVTVTAPFEEFQCLGEQLRPSGSRSVPGEHAQ